MNCTTNGFTLSRKKVAFIFLLIIALFGAYSYFSWPGCSLVHQIPASVEVRTVPGRALLGFNTDTDSLQFGAISPASDVTRSLTVQHVQDSQVRLTATGDIFFWLSISPQEFSLPAATSQQVFFTLSVPPNAAEGTYNGTVTLCFRE